MKEQAFPGPYISGHSGMSLRDYIAAQALSGRSLDFRQLPEEVARECYRLADAMLKVRGK